MSDTPRTDAAIGLCDHRKYSVVSANFARQFERELAEKTRLLVEAQKDAERLDWLDTVQCGFDHIGYGDYRYYVHGKGYSKAREVIDAAIKEQK